MDTILSPGLNSSNFPSTPFNSMTLSEAIYSVYHRTYWTRYRSISPRQPLCYSDHEAPNVSAWAYALVKKKGELRLWKCHTMAWHFNFMELHFAQKNGMFFFCLSSHGVTFQFHGITIHKSLSKYSHDSTERFFLPPTVHVHA